MPSTGRKPASVSALTEKLLAFIFGVIFVSIVLVVALFIPAPTYFQYEVFKIVLALAASGTAAIIPGFLIVSISNYIRAGGAIGVFTIVYFFSPVNLVAKVVPEHHSSLSLDCSDVTVTNNQEIPGVYPEASRRLLTNADIINRNNWQLRIMRNEIFARLGHIFNTDCLRNYFVQQHWYVPRVRRVDRNALTNIEKCNVDFLIQMEPVPNTACPA